MELTGNLRILRPMPGVLAFYDGRIEGQRFAPGPNWVDDGALSLGIASYALLHEDRAIVYDTHVSVPHARWVRAALAAEGVRDITVVLSHCHVDHIAGNEAFADCEIIANTRTLERLTRDRSALEAGTCGGPPAISPLILPSKVFKGEMLLTLGDREIVLIHVNIHSDDATVLWLPHERVLFAGDTLEDSVTYVDEPESFAAHLIDLERISSLNPLKVLPCHGAPDIIAAGGYDPSFIPATAAYVRWLMRLKEEPELARAALKEAIAAQLAEGSLIYWQPYETVHRQNIERVLAAVRAESAA